MAAFSPAFAQPAQHTGWADGTLDVPNPAIVVSGINKAFGKGDGQVRVLHDISFQLPAGEMSFLVGPSGCGKTTLISIMGAILNQDAGSVDVFGTRVSHLNNAGKTTFRKNNIGFIFQQFNLVNTVTAWENVAIPLLIRGESMASARVKALAMLEQVGLSDRAEFVPKDMSGGQQQRIAIARALVGNPRFLICDEPTASLDGQNGQTVMQLLKGVAVDSHRCVVVVTHDTRIYDYADRILTMEDGRMQAVFLKTPTQTPMGAQAFSPSPLIVNKDPR